MLSCRAARRFLGHARQGRTPKDWQKRQARYVHSEVMRTGCEDGAASILRSGVQAGDEAGGVQEPAVGKRRAKLSYKVRLWDKNAALDKIAKHLGMFVDRSVMTMNHNYSQMSEEELRFEIAAIHAEARALEAAVRH